ncbi:protein MAINTENANCE OF MERISTEMS-like [Glycine soja]|uniref:protein MAINTENANCE OF MERISTEMS-like n=1 Tax=Glycine soja TaxID=3848 RepID=UPI00103A04A9|nr:protein MAINTENANCE OF MERISTEMS-like [Glycine soja]
MKLISSSFFFFFFAAIAAIVAVFRRKVWVFAFVVWVFAFLLLLRGRALGQVTDRGVGRGDRDDSDDAPQRRRPTASARRQRVAVTVDHVDEPIIPTPDVHDDPMEAPAAVEDIPADTGTEAAEDEHQGFLGGPSDPSVLTLYADHVACSVWTGEERPELKLSSHGRKVHSLGRLVPAIEGLIAGRGLSPLIACSVDTGDRGLLSAFVERWHQETSSFHLPVGELTITLDDVSLLLHLPVIGDLHAFQPLHVDDAVQMLVDLLMVSTESARVETTQCRGPYVRLQWSATNVHVVYLEALRDLNITERYAWGVAALIYMYDQLNDTSLSHSRQLGGYITLLQCWIYEHFPSFAESTADQDYDEASPRACRSCYSGLLRWGPIAVYYRSERVVRQFGYTKTIPAPPVDSWVSYDDIHDRWMHYEDHIVPAGEVCVMLGACSSDYMDWFHISHPFMTPGHALDPLPHGHAPQPRVVPQASQTDIPHVPEARASSTSAEEPRHAVEVCDDIVERLERHLSLGVVTPGSSTHEVIEECLRLVRSVTQDHLVYSRCRRRRRTDQA